MMELVDSKIEWIGEIPSDWSVYSLSQVVDQVKNKNTDLAEKNLLSLSYGKIKRKNIDSSDGLLPASFDNYNIIEEGDIVLRLTDLQNDHTSLRVGRATERGIITSAYCTIRPIGVDSVFLYYLLHAYDIKKGFYGMGSGVRQGLNYSEVKQLRVSLPVYEKQIQISDYLQQVVGQIDSSIEDARKTIENYRMLRITSITEMILDKSNSNRKECIQSWMGSIPCDYDITKIKFVAEIYGRIGFRGYTQADLVDEGEGAITLSPSNLTDGKVTFDKCSYISWEKYEESPEIMIQPGDVIMVKTGSSYGKTSLVEELPCEATINPQLVVFKNISMDRRYFSYFLQTPLMKKQVDEIVSGGTIPTMSQQKMSNFYLVCPTLERQTTIADAIDKRVELIDEMIKEKEELIRDLSSYKDSLIYEIITGKKEV